MARPSSYTPEIAERICELIATSDRGLEWICADSEVLPHHATVYRWLAANPSFCDKYARAKERQADFIFSQILPIADDGGADQAVRRREDGSEYTVVDQEHVNRSRLRVDARKWVAAKLAPAKYGDHEKIDLKVEGTVNVADVLRARRQKRVTG